MPVGAKWPRAAAGTGPRGACRRRCGTVDMRWAFGGLAAKHPPCHRPAMRMTWGISQILLLIAVICFVLAAIGLDVKVSLIAVGLAFFAASFLVPSGGLRTP